MVVNTENVKFHPNRLRFMFVVNIVVALGLGSALLILPIQMYTFVGNTSQEVIWSTYGSSYMVAIGLLAIAGLRSPLKFSYILVVQAIAKSAWLLAVIVPALVAGPLPSYAILLGASFIPIIIGDVIVVPWRHLFAK